MVKILKRQLMLQNNTEKTKIFLGKILKKCLLF